MRCFRLLLVFCFCCSSATNGLNVALCIVGEARSFTIPFVHERTKANLIDSLGTNSSISLKVFLLLETRLAAYARDYHDPSNHRERWEVELLRNTSSFIEPDVLRYIHPPLKNRIDGCAHVGHNGQSINSAKASLSDTTEALLGQLVGWERCLSAVENFEGENRRAFDAIIKARPDSLWYEKVDFSALDLSSTVYLGDFWPGVRNSLNLKHEARHAGCNETFLRKVKAGLARAPSEASEASEEPLWEKVGRTPPRDGDSYMVFGSGELRGISKDGDLDERKEKLDLPGKQVRIIDFDVDLKLYRIEPSQESNWTIPSSYQAFISRSALYRRSECSSESIKRAAEAATAVNPFNGSWTRPSDHFFIVPRKLGKTALGWMREYRSNCTAKGRAEIPKQISWLLYSRLAEARRTEGIRVLPHWFPEVTARILKRNVWCSHYFRDGNVKNCTSFMQSITAWREVHDNRGRTFYFNDQTGETRWSKPPTSIPAGASIRYSNGPKQQQQGPIRGHYGRGNTKKKQSPREKRREKEKMWN